MNRQTRYLPTRSEFLREIVWIGIAVFFGVIQGLLSYGYDPSYDRATAVGISAAVAIAVSLWLTTVSWSLWLKGVGSVVEHYQERANEQKAKVKDVLSLAGVEMPDESKEPGQSRRLFGLWWDASAWLTYAGIQGVLAATCWILIDANVKVAHPNLYMFYLALTTAWFFLGVFLQVSAFVYVEIHLRLADRKIEKVRRVLSKPDIAFNPMVRTIVIGAISVVIEYYRARFFRWGDFANKWGFPLRSVSR